MSTPSRCVPSDTEDLARAIEASTVRLTNSTVGQWQLADDGKALIAAALRAYGKDVSETQDKKLVEACRGLVSYWTRNLNNFQWEKADDHVKNINAALPREPQSIEQHEVGDLTKLLGL